MRIVFGTTAEKEEILAKYPHTKQVLGDGGTLIVARAGDNILGFLWAFEQNIPIPNGKKEMFINVVEVFDAQDRCKGIGSLLVEKCMEAAKAGGCYQVRAYCDIGNIPSNMLWVKNGFAISPVKMADGNIPGSYVTYKL